MLLEQKVGIQRAADGAIAPVRSTNTGTLIVAEGQSRYYEQASRGKVFSLTIDSTDIEGIHIFGAGTGTTAVFALWNLLGSNFNISLLKFQVWASAGATMPVPPVMHGGCTAPTRSGVYDLYPVSSNIYGTPYQYAAKYISSDEIGYNFTGGGIPFVIRAADLAIGAGAVSSANLFMPKMVEYIDGDIVISPGYCWFPVWMSAGTAEVGYSVTWEEIPI